MTRWLKSQSASVFAGTMLLSGFAGISYEILYGRILADIIGDQFAVSASILITFLLGIGAGSIWAHRLWRWLWLIEAAIGAYGVAMALGSRALDALLSASVPLLPSGLGGAIAFGMVLLIAPAFLIGCSVPLFAGYFSRLTTGQSFSHVYAIYNLGAAITAFGIEFVLVRTLGIRGAVIAIAGVNGLVALSLALLFHSLARTPPPPGPLRGRPLSTPTRDLVALVLVSIASAVFQLFMVRLAELILGPFRETFAFVLSIVLLGIAVGSLAVQRWRLSFHVVLLAALAGTLFLAFALEGIVWMYAFHYEAAAEQYWTLALLKWLMLAVLMGVPAVAFGATIPALLSNADGDSVARDSGELLFVSSLANAAGFLLMTLVLHQTFGYGIQIIIIMLLTAAAIMVYRFQDATPVIATISLIGMAVLVLVTSWNEDFLYLSYTSFKSRDRLKSEQARYGNSEIFRGAQDIFSILWRGGNPYLFINGYVSIPLNNPSEMMVGAISSTFSPRTDRALVLGLGSGGTASAVGLLFDKTDVVEINPVIRDNIGRMARWNFDIEHNPNVNLIVDDGIHHIKHTSERYSLILNTVTTPLYFSSSKLYTRDFFEVVKTRLSPDGVYVTWMDSRIGDRGASIVLKTLKESFEQCSLFYVKSAYYLVLCSAQPVIARHPALSLKSLQLTRSLMQNYGIDTRWLAYHYLVKDAFSLLPDDTAPVNTVDFPVLEFEMTRLRETGVPKLAARIQERMNWSDVAAAVGSEADPGVLLTHAEKWLGNSEIPRRWRQILKTVPDSAEKISAAKLSFSARRAELVNDAASHYQVGLVLKTQGRTQDAIAEFDAALVLNPRLNDVHYMLGRSHEALGQLDLALQHYLREREIDPGDPDLPAQLLRLQAKLEAR